MELSSVPSRLLTPVPKPSAQGYFSAPTQRDSIPRAGSPSEDLASSTYLSPSIASASCASTSDICSVTSNGSVESYHLTPPISLPDFEKPPYKARSESAASLNMSNHQGDEPKETKDIRRRKRGRSKRKHRKHPGSPNQPAQSTGNQGHSLQYFPGYEGLGVTPADFVGDHRPGTNHVRGLNEIMEMNDDKQGTSSAQLMSVLAEAVTTRRWSSVGIGDPLPKAVTQTGVDGREKTLNRSNTWNTSVDNDVINAVRARLTLHEVSMNPPQNPMAITLRRASGMPGVDKTHLSTVAISGGTESIDPEQDQTDEQRPSPTYLITAEDINSVAEMIQCRLALQPKENKEDGETRRFSSTNKSNLVSDCAAAHAAIRVEDVKEAPEASQALSPGLQRPVLKRAEHNAVKLSRAFARKSVPEVIWEDTAYPKTSSPGSQTSSLNGSGSDVISKSNIERPIEDNSVTNPGETSSPAASAEEFSRRISAQGDTSPTSRVFKWVFKEPLKEDRKAKDKQSDEDPREALAKWKLPKISPPMNTWQSLEKHSTPTIDDPEVLSFPPLSGRQSTIDWISPLPDISAPVKHGKGKGKESLYDSGIDARTGNYKSSIASLPGFSIQPAPSNNPRHSLKSSKSNIEVRRKSSALPHSQPTPRTGVPFTVGNALGVSSGARRKSSHKPVHVKIDMDSLERHHHADGSSWIKPRKDSGWPAHKSPSPEAIDSRKASAVPPLQILLGLQDRKKSKRAHNRPRLMSGGLAPSLGEAGRQGAMDTLTSARADAVVSEVVCEGYGCGASTFSAKTVTTGLIG